MWRLLLVAGLLSRYETDAHAIAACMNGEGWAIASGATVPVHPRLVYYTDLRHGRDLPAAVKATIDGKPVTAKVTVTPAAPFRIAVVEIDSDKTGKLEIKWPEDDGATYQVAAKKPPAEVKGTTRRFHQAYHHSTVHESDDGLEVVVDAQAIAFTARWRRDAQTAWQTLELPANNVDGKQVARLGELGCASNFSVALLEKGVDLEVTALLADGRRVAVTGLPAHVVLAKLPANAEQSSP